IDRLCVRGGEFHSIANELLKAGVLDSDGVLARGYCGGALLAVGVRFNSAAELRADVGQRYPGVGHYGACRVRERADDGAALSLRPDVDDGEKQTRDEAVRHCEALPIISQ